MKTLFRKLFGAREHQFHEVNPVLLQQRRVRKSVFMIITLIAFYIVTSNMAVMFFQHAVSLKAADGLVRTLILLIFIAGLRFFPYHPRHYGFNLNRWKFNIKIGISLGLTGAVLAGLLRFYLYRQGEKAFGIYIKPVDIILFWLVYPVYLIIQDAVIKGLFQSYFVSIFEKYRIKKLLAITIASLLYAQLHIWHGGIIIYIATFLFSFVSGWIYEQSRSLLGVSIIHIMTGSVFYLLSNF